MTPDHPFAPTLSPPSFFETSGCGEALHRLADGLGAREPFLLVTGEPGMGKSALANVAIARWGSRVTAAYLAFPALSGTELLEEILRRFGAEPPQGASRPKLVACLEGALAEIAGRDQVAIIVVDDAHHLTLELFEDLRLLVNAAQQARRPLEVMLVGLPALAAMLDKPELVALRQRVSVRVMLEPLTAGETRRYIRHRLAAAGSDAPSVFSRKTCDEIAAQSGGVPRQINALAAEALRAAQVAGNVKVEAADIQAATPAPPVLPPAQPAPIVTPTVSTPPSPPIIAAAPEPATTPAPPTRHDASEWVARFIGDKGPVQIGAMGTPRSTWTPDEAGSEAAIPAGPRKAPARKRPGKGSGASSRSRPRNGGGARVPTIAALGAIVAITALVLGLRATGNARSRGARTSAVATSTGAVTQGIKVTASRARVAASTLAGVRPSVSAATSSRERYTLDAGVRLDLQTAFDERYRLQELTGIEGYVVPAAGAGAEQYTVVLGIYRSHDRAQAAAAALTRNQTLASVKVIPLPPKSLRQ